MARKLIKPRDEKHAEQLKKQRGYREVARENRRKLNRDWIANNRERYNASKYIYRERTKAEIIKHYSNGDMCCAFCGFNNIDGLCLDHINNNGAEHRKSAGIAGRNSAGTNTYEAVKRDGLPDGLQVLCANCNLIKEMERKRALRMENEFYKKRHKNGDHTI